MSLPDPLAVGGKVVDSMAVVSAEFASTRVSGDELRLALQRPKATDICVEL
jgi:hypothetical protein